MPIEQFSAQNFRCLESIELDAAPDYNLIVGRNGSGKTSILEALAYLGRGKSFRGAATSELVRHGCGEFVLFGRLSGGSRASKVGVRNSRQGLEIRVNGDKDGGAAALAAALPLQIVDPDVHDLVGGGPEHRRRYLDWLAFHVEQGYLDAWRRFRRVLKQRNAALRSGAAIELWDAEFVAVAAAVDAGRRHALDVARDSLEDMAAELVGTEIGFEYQRGWNTSKGLLKSLQGGIERDRQQGTTHCGPHRGDLKLSYDARRARNLVSRGQQKLLACSMILAATETAQTAVEGRLLLLLDDPAAELDGDALQRLMRRVVCLGCQVVATSLEAELPLFPAPPAMFHVEQGRLRSTA